VEDPVNQGCFPMVNMGNDGDISDILHAMRLKGLFFEIGCKGTPKNGRFLIFT
jgi:hypothetical protein